MKRILILTLLLLALAPAHAHARSGALDPSFGQRGKLVRSLELGAPAWDVAATGIAKIGEGRTIVLAGGQLLGLKPDGTPWRGFGGGLVEVPAPAGTALDLVDLATDSQGRILVGGTAHRPNAPGEPAQVREGRIFLARYTSTGALDRSFGEGGTLVSDLGLPPPVTIAFPPGASIAEPEARLSGLALDAAGRVVLAGIHISAIGPCPGSSVVRYPGGFAARLLEDGALDTSFGNSGHALVSQLEQVDPPAIDRSGGIYLSGLLGNDCSPTADLAC